QRTLGIPDEKLVVVERGVDGNRFRFHAPTRASLLRVLCVGRVEPAKDHVTAVRAIAELRRDGVECRLTIAGRGASHAEVERTVAELDLSGQVRIVEPVATPEDLYASHDVLLFPSRWEGL